MLARFVRWRRDSHGWRYGLLALAWAALTVATWWWTGQHWTVWLVSPALFFLTFEVGWSTIVGYGWLSTGNLEAEDDKFTREVLRLVRENRPQHEIADRLKVLAVEVEAVIERERAKLDRQRKPKPNWRPWKKKRVG